MLGSFIFGLPSDRPSTFEATAALAQRAGVTFAQFVMLTPFPGTLDFDKWEETLGPEPEKFGGIPLTRHWLIPQALRPKVYTPHPVMGADEIRERTQGVWDKFYSLGSIWQRSTCVKSYKSRLAFVLISKLYRQMYANTGIATDSARVSRSAQWARLIAKYHAAAVRGAADAGADGAGKDGAAAGRPGAQAMRPKVYTPHPVMSADEIRERTQGVWDKFYSLSAVWSRSTCVKSYKSRLAFVLISKLYRQMYANTGIATDSARVTRSAQWARLIAEYTRRLFVAPPMPDLTAPEKTEPRRAALARQTTSPAASI